MAKVIPIVRDEDALAKMRFDAMANQELGGLPVEWVRTHRVWIAERRIRLYFSLRDLHLHGTQERQFPLSGASLFGPDPEPGPLAPVFWGQK